LKGRKIDISQNLQVRDWKTFSLYYQKANLGFEEQMLSVLTALFSCKGIKVVINNILKYL
jgi:hypothetical protein